MTALAPMMDHVIHRTSEDERELLHMLGYVHVTGLAPKGLAHIGDTGQIGHNLRPRDLGRFGSNNGVDVIVTMGGEVWLACLSDAKLTLPRTADQLEDLLTKLCPHGSGAYVPCSNGESLSWRDIMHRFSNPDYEPRS
jgi:hypothetical protein